MLGYIHKFESKSLNSSLLMNSSQTFNSEFICLTLEKALILIMLHSKSSNFHLSRKIDIITEDGNNSTE